MFTSIISTPMNHSLSFSSRLTSATLCTVTGFCGGLVQMRATGATWVTGPVFGIAFGLIFVWLFSKRTTGAGSGLLWGLSYALLLWLAVVTGPLVIAAAVAKPGEFQTNRDSFPDLVGYILCFGVPLGLALGFRAGKFARNSSKFSIGRALVGGTLAGLVGGWAFGKWMEQVSFYPLIAGLVGSTSRMVGESLHFLFAVIIAISFAFLFQGEVRGLGSSMACGVAYGIFWWLLGPLTILPLWLGHRPDWSNEHASDLFGSLVGHILYGVAIGLLYALVDRMWVRFMTDSDPIRREPE